MRKFIALAAMAGLAAAFLSGCGPASFAEMSYQQKTAAINEEMQKCIAGGVPKNQANQCAQQNIEAREAKRQRINTAMENMGKGMAATGNNMMRTTTPQTVIHTGTVGVYNAGGF